MEFKGDIIISDPCYFITDDAWAGMNTNFKKLGFSTFLCESTLIGDWSCTTFDLDTEKPIGRFCADAGMVCVCLLEEVLKHNPDFDCQKNREGATVIENFDGEIDFEHFNQDFVYKNQAKSAPAIKVVGKGSVNFKTRQTGV